VRDVAQPSGTVKLVSRPDGRDATEYELGPTLDLDLEQ
jgi:hypothetical protein